MDMGHIFRNPDRYLKLPKETLESAQRLLKLDQFSPLGLGNIIINPNLKPEGNIQSIQPSIKDTVSYQPPSLVNAIDNMRQLERQLVNYQQKWPGRTANVAPQYTNLVRPEGFLG